MPNPRTRRLSSDAVLDRLTRLHPKAIDLSLDRVCGLLGRLGDPQDGMPPVVHVAGTNGKGSVVAFLAAILEAAGYAAHVYVSPHLVRFAERIRVAGADIADDTLVALLEECEDANRGDPVTFFEITTAAAFLAFARAPADVAILETGLGGRLDATNVFDRPALTVITPVGLDHQHYLGETLAAIAGEKAGILKAGIACVLAAQEPVAGDVIAARAARLGAPLVREGAEWSACREGDRLVYAGGGRQRRLPLPALPGAHQIRNAGLALAAADALEGVPVAESALGEGLRTVRWPARLQRLTRGPLLDSLPGSWDLWLDGGHNPGAGRALAAHAEGWREKPLHLIVGMMGSKDPAGFLGPLAAAIGLLRAVAVPGEAGSFAAQAVAEAARSLGLDARPAAGVAEALRAIVEADPRPARVLVCGSLYLAGTVLRENG